MFILQLLPSEALQFVIFSILGFGLVVTLVSLFFINPLLRLIPALAGYYQLIQLGGIALFLLGVYLWGGYSTEMKWRAKVDEAKAAKLEAEAKFEAINLELALAIAQRDHAVATRGQTIIKKTTEYLRGDVETHTVNLSEVERAELKKQIDELRKAEKECPVPKLIVKGVNEAAAKVKQ